MPDDLKPGSTAAAPAAEGADDVVDAGSTPEDMREELLASFREPDDTGDGGGQGDVDGEPDAVVDDPPAPANAGDAGNGDGQPADADDPDPADKELDQVEQTMGRKQRRAFAGLRKAVKESRDQLAQNQELASFGKTIQGTLEELQVTPEQFRDTLSVIASRQKDPLRAVKALKGMLDEAATAAEGEYPKEAVTAILGAGADAGGAGDAEDPPLEELDQGLAQAVDYGLMTEEHARSLLAARTTEPNTPGDGAGGGDDGGDGGDGGGAEMQIADKEKLVADLHEMGYYSGLTTEEQYVQRVQEELIPRAVDIADGLGVDMSDPERLQRVMVTAARELVAERKAAPPQGKRKPPVSQRRGTAAPKRNQASKQEVPADDEEFREFVLSQF